MGTFTVETSMCGGFLTWHPQTWCCQDGATTAAGCGEVYGWRLSEALGRWARGERREILTGFIEKWVD